MKVFIVNSNDEQWVVLAKDEASCYNIMVREGFGGESLVPIIAASGSFSLHPRSKLEEGIFSYFKR